MNHEELVEMCEEHDLNLDKMEDLFQDLENDGMEDDILEIAQEMFTNDLIDFEVGKYRFIDKDEIDNIMINDLVDDSYNLGAFNADFISEVTDLPQDMIEVLQAAGEFEMIGDYVIDHDLIGDFQDGFVSQDGYGPHFAHYDGYCTELAYYYYFRIK